MAACAHARERELEADDAERRPASSRTSVEFETTQPAGVGRAVGLGDVRPRPAASRASRGRRLRADVVRERSAGAASPRTTRARSRPSRPIAEAAPMRPGSARSSDPSAQLDLPRRARAAAGDAVAERGVAVEQASASRVRANRPPTALASPSACSARRWSRRARVCACSETASEMPTRASRRLVSRAVAAALRMRRRTRRPPGVWRQRALDTRAGTRPSGTAASAGDSALVPRDAPLPVVLLQSESIAPTPRRSRPRATTRRWISEVPSQMRSTRSSRHSRSAAFVRM